MTSQEKAFRDFARFVGELKGDEKSEAQTFLFHLLEAFGHDPNTVPESATFEYRVRFAGIANGGSSRREKAHSNSEEEDQSLLTSAATRFIRRGSPDRTTLQHW